MGYGGRRSGSGRKLKPYAELRISKSISLKRCEWKSLESKEYAKLLQLISEGISKHGDEFFYKVMNFVESQ